MVRRESWNFQLPAEFGYQDVTEELHHAVSASGIAQGVVVVSVKGSTAAVTTIEAEPGALADLRAALDRLAPVDAHYDHNARWGDGNGFSHVRSALLKTSQALPIVDGVMQVGTWQQVIAVNLDNRPRRREVTAVMIGE